MRLLKIILVIITTSGLSHCTNNHKVSKEGLSKAINKFNTAFQEGNTDVLASMIAEDYLHTNGNSRAIGKKDWINYLSKRENAIKSGNLEVLDYGMEEMEIEFYDNVAIVSGKVIVSNKENGEIRKNEYRITNVWVYDVGNWKRAGFHDGKIK